MKTLDESCAYKTKFYDEHNEVYINGYIFPHEEKENIYWYFMLSDSDIAYILNDSEESQKLIDFSAFKLNKREILYRHSGGKWHQVQDDDGPPTRDFIRRVCLEARSRMVIEKMLST